MNFVLRKNEKLSLDYFFLFFLNLANFILKHQADNSIEVSIQ